MADTIRTESQALALLVVGGTGTTTVQRVRDAIYSLYRKAYFSTAITLPALADASVSTPAASTVALYYSTTHTGLAFKDSAGVVHHLAESP